MLHLMFAKLILIAFFKFQHVTMMVFNVCVNHTVQLP